MPLLYVHVPFCERKCSYCAFYSEPLGEKCSGDTRENEMSAVEVQEYLKAIEIETDTLKKDAPHGVSSLFIGGGTPTALKENELRHLLKIMQQEFLHYSPNIEKTVEANPGTLTLEKLKILKDFGINRISLGVQTFSDSLLKRIGRIHSEADIHKSIEMIRQIGFTNLNLDLMFGLPRQNLALWKDSLTKALAYRPQHFSLYALIIEEGTPLAKSYAQANFDLKELAIPNDDVQAQMYEYAVRKLEQNGYIHYETSNFALPGYECQHNIGYWTGMDYLGLGPGAVSCLQGRRWQNLENIEEYVSLLNAKEKPIAEEEILTKKDRMTERIMLGLRMRRGIDLNAFKEEFGVEFTDIYSEIMESYISRGILELEGDYLRLNSAYSFVANSVIVDFI